MKVRRCSDNVIQLTRLAAVFPMNCFLVIEPDGLTLVDSTIRSPAQDVGRLAQELGLPLRRLALTHAHSDHVGGVAGIQQTYPDVEIAISARDARLLKGERTPDPGEPQDPVKGSFAKIDWTPSRELQPGDRVGSLEVVPSPGHTPGHVAFLETRSRTLIAGDAFQTRGGIAVAGTVRPLFPFVAFGTWHKPTALTSAIELRKLDAVVLAVGHGMPIRDPGAAMDQAIRAAGQRQAGDESLLRANGSADPRISE